MGRHATNRTSQRGGFTLVELIIVAVMLGVLAAIGLPALMPGRSVPDHGANVLSTTLMLAQRYAVVEQRNVIVRIDVDRAEVIVHVDMDHDETVDDGERVQRSFLGEDVLLGTQAPPREGETPPVTFSKTIDNMPALIFRRNGSASEAGAVYLTWANGNESDSRLVSVIRATGRAEVYRYDGDSWVPKRR